jgi:hypothetical protein
MSIYRRVLLLGSWEWATMPAAQLVAIAESHRLGVEALDAGAFLCPADPPVAYIAALFQRPPSILLYSYILITLFAIDTAVLTVAMEAAAPSVVLAELLREHVVHCGSTGSHHHALTAIREVSTRP